MLDLGNSMSLYFENFRDQPDPDLKFENFRDLDFFESIHAS